MRSYGIYKVKKMYQPFVIGREQLLYDLLTENPENSENLPEVHYLCDILERQVINEAIVSNLGKLFPTIECEEWGVQIDTSCKRIILISLSSYSFGCIL